VNEHAGPDGVPACLPACPPAASLLLLRFLPGLGWHRKCSSDDSWVVVMGAGWQKSMIQKMIQQFISESVVEGSSVSAFQEHMRDGA
jgi:hypothetical protein